MEATRFTWNDFLEVLAAGASASRARQAAASMRAADSEAFANRLQEAHLEAHRAIASLADEISTRGAPALAEIALEQQHLAQLEAGFREDLERRNAMTERALQDYLASHKRVPLALKLLGARKS